MDAASPPTWRGDVLAGLSDIWPVMLAVAPIAGLFGALAIGKGLSIAEASTMSVLVFAGGAQFAALELWTYPVPVAALVFSTLLINARHVLMGASLMPKLGRFTWLQRLAGMFMLTDEAWALAERRALTRSLTPGYWFALAGTLGLTWIVCSVLGAWLGSFLGDPRRIGADFAFTALFIGLIAGFWNGRVAGATIAASGIAAAVTYATVGTPWHVAAGAFAGIAAAYFAAPGPR